MHLCHLTQFGMAYNQKPIAVAFGDAESSFSAAEARASTILNGSDASSGLYRAGAGLVRAAPVSLPSEFIPSNEYVVAADAILAATAARTRRGGATSLQGVSMLPAYRLQHEDSLPGFSETAV